MDIFTTTRRRLLTGLAAASAATAMPASAAPLAARAPEYADLTRYYAFLWTEFQALGDELGVGQHDSLTAHRNGDIAALAGALSDPPSTRALTVLASLAVDRASLASETHKQVSSQPSAEELARTKLKRAAMDIREAMALLGHDDFMVFVKDEPTGLRLAKVIDFRAGGRNYAFET